MNEVANKNIKVLYVEDDEIARENGVEYLENFFEHIYEAADAISALKLYEQYSPDIIITDIQMPKMNGLEFVKKIRKNDSKTQIIIITAFSETEYLLKAVELKLVKYLIKPVKESAFEEALNLCIESMTKDDSNIIELAPNSYFDTFNLSLVVDNELVKLRTKEIELLKLLIKYKNRYVTYIEIENFVWQDTGMSKDALKTVIKNLKSKLPNNLILNLTGTGYKIEL